MQIRGESKREIGEISAGGGGVEVARGGAAGDEAVEEADRNGGDEAEQESENRDGYSDRRRHGFHFR